MPPDQDDGITLAEARRAVGAGARIRAVLCVLDSATGAITPFFRFLGKPRWRRLQDRRGASTRIWTSFDRLLATLRRYSLDCGCYLVCSHDHRCLQRMGIAFP